MYARVKILFQIRRIINLFDLLITLYFIFYILYIIEWLFKVICNVFYWKIRAYRSISFEQIAYKYQNDYDYQDTRKRFDWVPYIFKFVLRD